MTKSIVSAIAIVSFAAGSLVSAHLTPHVQARGDSNRVFELLMYHTRPGREPALESIFRDASVLMAKHGIDVVGYWVPDGDPAWADTFVYLVAHPSREDAKRNWDAVHAEPAMKEYVKQAAADIIEKVDNKYHVDEVYMRPTDYSAMK